MQRSASKASVDKATASKPTVSLDEMIRSLPSLTRDERIALIKALFAIEDTPLYTADDLQAMVDREVTGQLNRQLSQKTGTKVIDGVARVS